MPPPRWTDPVLVKAAPLTTRNKEVEELRLGEPKKKKRKRSADAASRAKQSENTRRHVASKYEARGGREQRKQNRSTGDKFVLPTALRLPEAAEGGLSLRCHFALPEDDKVASEVAWSFHWLFGWISGRFLAVDLIIDALGETDTLQKSIIFFRFLFFFVFF